MENKNGATEWNYSKSCWTDEVSFVGQENTEPKYFSWDALEWSTY